VGAWPGSRAEGEWCGGGWECARRRLGFGEWLGHGSWAGQAAGKGVWRAGPAGERARWWAAGAAAGAGPRWAGPHGERGGAGRFPFLFHSLFFYFFYLDIIAYLYPYECTCSF
jgi:hypothetical protein